MENDNFGNVLFREAILFSEDPLSEVPLYLELAIYVYQLVITDG